MKFTAGKVVKQFLKATTLHGFKYLGSPFFFDRAFWLAWGCVSACCAGVLSTALWARFLEMPKVLALDAAAFELRSPFVAVCPSPVRIAELFTKRLSLRREQSRRLPAILSYLIQRKRVPQQGLVWFENLLNSYNLTLVEALLTTTPTCSELITKCRLQSNTMVPCDQIFTKELTPLGVCCVVESEKWLELETISELPQDVPVLDMVLNCSDYHTLPNGCEFFMKYHGEEFITPITMTTGLKYKAYVRIVTVISSNAPIAILDDGCASNPLRNRQMCQIQCKESRCGCSDPLRVIHADETNVLPPCPIRKINCLRNFQRVDKPCNCADSCKKITTIVSMERRVLTQINNTFDPIAEGIVPSKTTILTVIVQDRGSKVFRLKFLQTWWSLLSNFGGIFNLFLGVGLFSTLEIIFFAFWKLPASTRNADFTFTTSRHFFSFFLFRVLFRFKSFKIK